MLLHIRINMQYGESIHNKLFLSYLIYRMENIRIHMNSQSQF